MFINHAGKAGSVLVASVHVSACLAVYKKAEKLQNRNLCKCYGEP